METIIQQPSPVSLLLFLGHIPRYKQEIYQKLEFFLHQKLKSDNIILQEDSHAGGVPISAIDNV